MRRPARLAAIIALLCCAPFQVSAQQLSIEEFETQLDFTIRSACHGNMIDAIPDFLSDARDWLNENTPFCQTVRTMAEDESAYTLLKRQQPSADYTRDPQYKIKYLAGYNEDLYRHTDCGDWMCEHIRDEAYDKGNPVSLAQYRQVEQHCDGDYGCIESWFKSWPRALPKPKTLPKPETASTGMSLDSLMGSQPTASQATDKPQGSPSGLSLDALLDSGQPDAIASSGSVIDPHPPTSGLSLDSVMDTTQHKQSTSPDVSLDNIFEGREQLALEKSLKRIQDYNNRLSSNCGCSVENSGCYQLPAESLLDTANELEQARYDSCSQWQQITLFAPTTSDQAKQVISQLTKIQNTIARLDDEMEEAISDWEAERRRMIAQQQQEAHDRSESAYLAGMASILVQATAVTNGSLSVEQAAQNAVNVSNDVQNGRSWGSAMTRNIMSSIPNPTGSNSAYSGSTSGSANGSTGSRNFVVNETYHYTCESGTSGSAPIKSYSTACANAMKRYARAAGCNLYEEQEAAQNAYYSACASEMYE
ncbi:Uncharacterised protein [Halioglobus japonicus]|nr:Uncharacterised protein [Halioglobus japonicus]